MFILSKNCFALVLVLGLLLRNVNISDALACYTCGPCDSKEGTETPCPDLSHYQQEFPKANKAACATIKDQSANATIKVCKGTDQPTGCSKKDNKEICYCTTDLCNKSHGPASVSQLLILSLYFSLSQLIPVDSLTTFMAYPHNNGLF